MIVNYLILFFVSSAFSARILGVVPIPSYSHQVFFHSLWKELSLRGHQVTVITTNPVKDPLLTNLTEIDINFAYETFKFKEDTKEADMVNTTLWSLVLNSLYLGKTLLEMELQHPEIQTMIQNKTEHFDLVMVVAIFPAMYAFSERFKCPFIGMTSADSRARNYRILGNPNHPVFVYGNVIWEVLTTYNQQFLIDKYFGEGLPSLGEIERKMSMMFTNTDLIFHPIRPLLPNIVQIGGATHLKTSKPLPKDLKEQLDAAKTGFIYFSLGSNFKSKGLSLEIRRIILETFSELPYLVLWKFELEKLPGQPKNVLISKWFPQQDIFNHPNIKLFISQGGLQSMEEAIYSSVPIVGMPFFGDQPRNVKTITKNGMGLGVDVNKISKETFKATILEVIENPKYRNNVKKMVELAKDQPMTGLEKAVWWTEYVIRHQGAKHLKSPALDIPLYQYYLLDVLVFFAFIVLLSLFVIIKVSKLVLMSCKSLFRTKLKTQ